MSRGNRAILWVEGWASISPDRSLGTLCKWSDSSRVGNVTPGRLVDGETKCACATQVLAQNQLTQAQRKAISWGPPHVLPRVKGDPFTDGKIAGYSHWWEPDGVAYGFASRWASGSQTGPRYLSPMVAEGRLLGDAGVLRGSRHGVGTHRATQDACPLERPLENPRSRPPVQVCPMHTVWAKLGVPLRSVAQGKLRGPLRGMEGFCFHGQVPRDPVKRL